MAIDFTSRPKPPVLKRFANLEIDGVERPDRPERPRRAVEAGSRELVATTPTVATRAHPPTPRPAERDDDMRDLERMADEVNANARAMRQEPVRGYDMVPGGPAAQNRARRADELRRQRPPDPMPAPRLSQSSRVDLEVLLGSMVPGVMTMEMDLRRPRQPARSRPPAALQPLELTPMAARQIQLMAWEAGVPGSGLRILTSNVGGLGRPEIDFAFDDKTEPDDLVFECHGVTIMIDPGSLRWVAGRRITWHEVPGSEGFRVG